MKHALIRLTVLTVAVFLIGEASVGQWYPQNSGTTKNLNAVSFTDANNGFAVGDSGTILQTTNGGEEWLMRTSGTIKQLNGLQFIDVNSGFAVGDIGTVLKTTDGGVSWVEVQIGTTKKLRDICFVNDHTGWIVGGNDSEVSPDTGIVLHTTNGGISWIQQTCNAQWQLNGVCFSNENNGWVVGGGGGAFFRDNRIILNTTDGGSSWMLQLSDSLPRLSDVRFLNNNIGWAVGGARGLDHRIGGIIIGTTDGGVTWTTLVDAYRIFHGISMVDHNLGLVVGRGLAQGLIVTTHNGFSNWTEQWIVDEGALRSVSLLDAFNGWAVGDYGTILHTTNGGVTFIEGEQTTEVPTEFSLHQNYPNPFNPVTTIRYALPEKSMVTLTVSNTLGQEVATLVQGENEAGHHDVRFNAAGFASGVYFYRLAAGGFVETKRMVLLK